MKHTEIPNQVRIRNLNASPSKDPDKLFKKFCFRFSLSCMDSMGRRMVCGDHNCFSEHNELPGISRFAFNVREQNSGEHHL